MTLVVSCISTNHVVQVSDRRLTWIHGLDQGRVAEDDSNKAVVVCNRLVLAYTGLAQIGNRKTDEWALDVAASVVPYNPQRVFEAIAARATDEFRRISLPKVLRRHAFLISGWARFDDQNAPLTPFVCAVSNALDSKWHWLAEALDEFQILAAPLDDRPFLLASVGQLLHISTFKRLRRAIHKCVRRDCPPEDLIQVLATAIRATADINRSVGRNLMAISLPLRALDRDSGLTIPLAFPTDVGMPLLSTFRIQKLSQSVMDPTTHVVA